MDDFRQATGIGQLTSEDTVTLARAAGLQPQAPRPGAQPASVPGCQGWRSGGKLTCQGGAPANRWSSDRRAKGLGTATSLC